MKKQISLTQDVMQARRQKITNHVLRAYRKTCRELCQTMGISRGLVKCFGAYGGNPHEKMVLRILPQWRDVIVDWQNKKITVKQAGKALAIKGDAKTIKTRLNTFRTEYVFFNSMRLTMDALA